MYRACWKMVVKSIYLWQRTVGDKQIISFHSGKMQSTIVTHQKQYTTGFENILVGVFYSLQYQPQIPMFRRKSHKKQQV